MRPGAILINTARGALVDEHALLEALDSGHVSAAGLDVVEREPLDNDRLRAHPNVLLTPHTAFYSVEGYTELRTKTAEEVRRILLGEPPRNPVNSPGKCDRGSDSSLASATAGGRARDERRQANRVDAARLSAQTPEPSFRPLASWLVVALLTAA